MNKNNEFEACVALFFSEEIHIDDPNQAVELVSRIRAVDEQYAMLEAYGRLSKEARAFLKGLCQCPDRLLEIMDGKYKHRSANRHKTLDKFIKQCFYANKRANTNGRPLAGTNQKVEKVKTEIREFVKCLT